MSSPTTSAETNLPTSGWLTILLLAVLFSCIQGRMCFAADTYTLTQNQQVNFGTLQQPSSGSQTFTIRQSGSTLGTGTLLYGIPANGDYTIKCTGTCTDTLTISLGMSAFCAGVSGVGGSVTINYNNGEYIGTTPGGGLSNPGASGKDLRLGIGISYTSSVSVGVCSASFSIGVLPSGGSAVVFPQTLAIAFDVGLSLTKNADINFGTVSALNASTYRISTAGALSTVSGSGIPLYGATAAGNIQIVGSTTDGITISVGGYIANNGVTPANAQCSYNGGAAGSCSISGAAPGSGTTLLVGVDVAADGTQAGGTTAAPTFTITVAYQ